MIAKVTFAFNTTKGLKTFILCAVTALKPFHNSIIFFYYTRETDRWNTNNVNTSCKRIFILE